MSNRHKEWAISHRSFAPIVKLTLINTIEKHQRHLVGSQCKIVSTSACLSVCLAVFPIVHLCAR